jgi:hypothetical protein
MFLDWTNWTFWLTTLALVAFGFRTVSVDFGGPAMMSRPSRPQPGPRCSAKRSPSEERIAGRTKSFEVRCRIRHLPILNEPG